MNVNTGELMRQYSDEYASQGFTPIPEDLMGEANKVLGERDQAMVDLNSNTPLANWAHKKRNEKAAKKKRRKMVKSSRRKNR